MRIFVALDLPEEVRQALAQFAAGLRACCAGARWTRPEGIHVTLKFIGETKTERVESIQTALAGVHSPHAVDLRFRGAGFFPDARRPRVFWAGVEASPNLTELASAVEAALQPLGIPPETRPFAPHLTLARFKSEDGLAQLLKALEQSPAREFGAARATEFHLYQSILKPNGAHYLRLASFPFTEAAA
jgi:RNA 2',3'-cyclic 3'-phosphodiesterase